MLVLDANIWVSAFDAGDPHHPESVALLAAAARRGEALAGPALLLLESVCALARRTGDPELARAAGERLAAHPALRLEPMDDDLLATALHLGTALRLRGGDALYAATAALLACPLLSWDAELVARGGAESPRTWLAREDGPADLVSEG